MGEKGRIKSITLVVGKGKTVQIDTSKIKGEDPLLEESAAEFVAAFGPERVKIERGVNHPHIWHKKCWPDYFKLICSGEKASDIRLADFDLKEGDTVVQEEWDPTTGDYTGVEACLLVRKCFKVDLSDFYPPASIVSHGVWLIEFAQGGLTKEDFGTLAESERKLKEQVEDAQQVLVLAQQLESAAYEMNKRLKRLPKANRELAEFNKGLGDYMKKWYPGSEPVWKVNRVSTACPRSRRPGEEGNQGGMNE